MRNSIITLGIFLTFLISFLLYISYNNTENSLRQAVLSKQEDSKNQYSAMWQIIKSQASISDKYANDFKEIYPKLISGRYKNDKTTMMKWVQERNPDFDVSLYKKLMNTIEIQRSNFKIHQTSLIDLNREHKTFIKSMPERWFIDEKNEIEIVILQTKISEKAFETGTEEEMELFKVR